MLESANLSRVKRLAEELAAMGDKPVAELADYRELMVSENNSSTIRINKMVYSVPSRLIGVKLLAQIHENFIVLLNGSLEVARLPLCRADRGAVIELVEKNHPELSMRKQCELLRVARSTVDY